MKQTYKDLSKKNKDKIALEISLSKIVNDIRLTLLNDMYHDVDKKPKPTTTRESNPIQRRR